MKCRVNPVLTFPGLGAENAFLYVSAISMEGQGKDFGSFFLQTLVNLEHYKNESTAVEKYLLEKCRNRRSWDYSLSTGNLQQCSDVVPARAYTMFSKCKFSSLLILSLQSVPFKFPPDEIEQHCQVLSLCKAGLG